MGHALMENRHGLVVQADATHANGTAEREAALEMIDRQAPGTSNQLTLGADKAYDASGFVADLSVKRLRTVDQDRRRRVDHPLGCDDAAPRPEARSAA